MDYYYVCNLHSTFGLGELITDIEAGPEGHKAGARLLSIIDDPLPSGKVAQQQ